jgi:hypothetical protein
MPMFKVWVKEWNEGYVMVEAENADYALEIAEVADDELFTWVEGDREILEGGIHIETRLVPLRNS